MNRHQKRDHDAAGWLPPMNRCWFVARVIDFKRAYGLTVDRERDALARTLAGCEDTEIDMTPQGTIGVAPAPPNPTRANAGGGNDALALYDDNGNSRITRGATPRHSARAPEPPGLPVHAGRRRRRRRLRVGDTRAPAAGSDPSTRRSLYPASAGNRSSMRQPK